MDIRTFLGAFQNGFQPSNRFVLQIWFSPELVEGIINRPAARVTARGVPSGPLGPEEGLSLTHAIDWLQRGLLCDKTRMPDRSLDVVQMTQYGITEQYPYKTDYTALDSTFLLPLYPDGSNPVLQVFSAWQNVIQDVAGGMDSTRDLSWPDSYRTDIYLTLFDYKGNPSVAYRFEKAYPKTVESVPVTWGDQSEMSELSVTFAFTSWYIVTGASPLPIPTEALGPFGVFGIGIPTPIGVVRI